MRKLWITSVVLIAFLTCLPVMVSAQSGASNAQSATVTIKDIQGPSVTQALSHSARTSWPWYVARASGMIAAATLFLLVLSGIGQITGKTYRFLEPLTAWATHRSLGLTFGLAVIVHMVSLLFDTFVPFSILQILVPWLSKYRPVHIGGISFGSLYVALGVLAFYAVAAVIVTSLVWVEKKPYLWKSFHILAYMIVVFAYVHALYIGTDVSHGIFRTLWFVMGILLAGAILHRLWRARTI